MGIQPPASVGSTGDESFQCRCSSGVEQVIRNDQVVGSNPTSGSSFAAELLLFSRTAGSGSPRLGQGLGSIRESFAVGDQAHWSEVGAVGFREPAHRDECDVRILFGEVLLSGDDDRASRDHRMLFIHSKDHG